MTHGAWLSTIRPRNNLLPAPELRSLAARAIFSSRMSGIMSQAPQVRMALDEFKRRLAARWSRDLVTVCLFGSRARGEANAWSDVDVAVVLERAGFREKKETIDIASDVGLEHGLLI